jgi:hypothetical protein
MLNFNRLAGIVALMTLSYLMIWFGLSFSVVIESLDSVVEIFMSVGSILTGIAIATYALSLVPSLLDKHPEPDADELHRAAAKTKYMENMAHIAAFLILAILACFSVFIGLQIRPAWESWVSNTFIMFGVSAAALAIYFKPWKFSS